MRSGFSLGDITVHRMIEMERPSWARWRFFPTSRRRCSRRTAPGCSRQALDRQATGSCSASRLRGAHAAPHHPDRHLRRQPQAAPTRPFWNMMNERSLREGPGGRRAWRSTTSTSSCARICMSTMSAGTRGSRTAAGCRPSRRRATSSPNASSHFGRRTRRTTGRRPSVTDRAADRRGQPRRGRRRATCAQRHVRLIPTPGHTLDHTRWVGRGRRQDAVITGDMIHSPLQARYPDLSPAFDTDSDAGRRTRRSFLERYCDTATLMCTAHFPSPSIGRITRWGDGFRCEMVEA